MLYVHIGTTNDAKTHAIRSIFEAYRGSLLKTPGVNVSGTAGRIEYFEHPVQSGVDENPRDFDEEGRRGQIRSWLFTVDSGKGRLKRRESLFG